MDDGGTPPARFSQRPDVEPFDRASSTIAWGGLGRFRSYTLRFSGARGSSRCSAFDGGTGDATGPSRVDDGRAAPAAHGVERRRRSDTISYAGNASTNPIVE